MRVWLVMLVTLIVLGGCVGDDGAGQPSTKAPAPVAGRVTPTPYPSSTLPAVNAPAWARTAVMYQIFVRSFQDSNGDGVGDLAGITQKLDYLQDLGVTVLWLTPIFASSSYHGYDTVDYYTIQPEFGKREDLIKLVDEAHKRGIRILLDYVAAHTSNQHPNFKDAFGNPASKFSEFYRWTNPQHTAYESFFGVKELPTLNHKNEAVQKFLLDIAKYWLDLDGDGDYKDGVDGFRADYVLNVPHEFWKRLRKEVKALNPDALLLAEAWKGNVREIQPYLEDEFDAVFDFPFHTSLQGSPEKSGDGILPGASSARALVVDMIAPLIFYPTGAVNVSFINNHDTNRVMSEVNGNLDRAKLGATLLFTAPGVPIVYYGEEIGMKGTKSGEPVWDITRREPMDWYTSEEGQGMTRWWKTDSRNNRPADGISVEEQQGKSGSLLELYKTLAKLRKTSAALHSGRYEPVKIADNDRVYGHLRRTDSEIVLALFNFGAAAATVEADVSETGLVHATYGVTDALTGKTLGELKPPTYKVELPAAGALVLSLKAR